MHITEGILSAPVLAGGALATVAGLWPGLRAVNTHNIPRVGLMAATLFVASLIHVPVGVSSAHLLLHGLAGILLGWAVFPAVLIALLLQALLFQFGGLTTLGVNTAMLAWPALLCALVFGPAVRKPGYQSSLAAFAAGAFAVLGAALLATLSLVASGQEFWNVGMALLVVHSPIMLLEGFICAACIAFLRSAKPQMLAPPSAMELSHAK